MNISAGSLAKNEETAKYQVSGQLLQPWSTPVLKTALPQPILAKMLAITDSLIEDSASKSHGNQLVGQIDKELTIPIELLEASEVKGFFESMTKNFVLACKLQEHPFYNDVVKSVDWHTEIAGCWVVSQKPNEYNPLHFHKGHVSAVMYLKVPKMESSRKNSDNTDGSIESLGVGSRDRRLSTCQLKVRPAVGDFYIFGAGQLHTVYPYRCSKGDGDTERRSVSFNAVFSGDM